MPITNHAEQRLQQRGMREQDVNLVLAHGTAIDRHRVVLTHKDAEREIHRRKKEIERFERCRDCIVVTVEASVVTAYRLTDARGAQKLARTLRSLAQ